MKFVCYNHKTKYPDWCHIPNDDGCGICLRMWKSVRVGRFKDFEQRSREYNAVYHTFLSSVHLTQTYFSGDIGNYYYGQGHPMKPHRIRMTHNLILNYGLYRKMEIYVSYLLQNQFYSVNVQLFKVICLNTLTDSQKTTTRIRRCDLQG